MALVKSVLQAAIATSVKAINAKMTDPGMTADAYAEDLATAIADAVDAFVKTGTIATTVTGACTIPLTSPPGTPSAGTIAGSGTGTIS